MKTELIKEKLTNVLRAAGSAQHEYETNQLVGVRDDQWDGWHLVFTLDQFGEITTPRQAHRL